jgi:hypothetical protein
MPAFKGWRVFLLICSFKDCSIFFSRAMWPSGLLERALRQAALQVLASSRQAVKSSRQTLQIVVRGFLLLTVTLILQGMCVVTLIRYTYVTNNLLLEAAIVLPGSPANPTTDIF